MGAHAPSAGGGSLPDNVGWDENILNVYEASNSAVDPVSLSLFQLKTLTASGVQLAVRIAAYFSGAFTTYNDNGDELLESDPLANGGDGEVRIGGVAIASGVNVFPITLAEGESVQFVSADDPDVRFQVSDTAGVLQFQGYDSDGILTLNANTNGGLGISDGLGGLLGVFALPPVVPEVPATPDAQDIVDALSTLGLVTQAA